MNQRCDQQLHGSPPRHVSCSVRIHTQSTTYPAPARVTSLHCWCCRALHEEAAAGQQLEHRPPKVSPCSSPSHQSPVVALLNGRSSGCAWCGSSRDVSCSVVAYHSYTCMGALAAAPATRRCLAHAVKACQPCPLLHTSPAHAPTNTTHGLHGPPPAARRPTQSTQPLSAGRSGPSPCGKPSCRSLWSCWVSYGGWCSSWTARGSGCPGQRTGRPHASRWVTCCTGAPTATAFTKAPATVIAASRLLPTLSVSAPVWQAVQL